MGEYGEPVPDVGPLIAPLAIVRALRWREDLTGAEVVEAIQSVADHPDVSVWWPELTAAEVAELRRLARDMSKSRLRAWDARRERQPTWLEVRALISGLRLKME